MINTNCPVCLTDNLPRTTDSRGNPLPEPRFISTNVAPTDNQVANVSNMVMAWGQFIDHDFTGTPVIKSKETEEAG